MATRKAREQRVSTIVIDGLNEEDFRRSIENRLREGMVGAAIERLRPLLKPYACPGGLLPERFLTVSANDLVLSGWDALRDAFTDGITGKDGAPPLAKCIELETAVGIVAATLTVDPGRRRSRAREALTGLINRSLLGCHEGWIWKL